MKRIISVGLAGIAMFLFAGCAQASSNADAEPVSIIASGAKTEFVLGERFSVKGLTVTVQMSDGEAYAAKSGEYRYDSSKFDSSKAGTYPITVTLVGYNLSDTYEVNVADTGVEETKIFSIANISAWLDGAPSDFVPLFEGKPIKDAEIEYRYDEEMIQLNPENRTIIALKTGTATVEASYKEEDTTFTVECYPAIDLSDGKYNTADYDAYAACLSETWKEEGSEHTTVFIGDSFFDARFFWTNFYETYAGKDALCFGISATTSFDWEKYLLEKKIFGDTAPKNIAIHVGTNNLYDDLQGEDATLRDLQRLFLTLHEMYPSTKIYYFGVSLRIYDTIKIEVSKNVNRQISTWCNERDWIEYLDTPSVLTPDKLRDGDHPKLEWYSIFTGFLNAAGAEIEESEKKSEAN